MLTPRQLELYNNLISISGESRKDNPFYYVDQPAENGFSYRIFGYMILSSYSDWLVNQDTLWARGTTFLIDENKNPIWLAALPMKKFFNLDENPLANLGHRILEENVLVTDKLDGSLMSTYIDQNGELKLKSKMSTKSEHCQKAMELLNSEEYSDLKSIIDYYTVEQNCTIDLEWTAPENRIVLGYDKSSLTILSVQSRSSIKTIDIPSDLKEYAVKTYDKSILETVKETKNIEGYIVEFSDKTRLKIKSDWYCMLHKTKELISTPKNLYESCLNEQVDDLKALFVGDEFTIKQIDEMNQRASKEFYGVKSICEEWYNQNKDLDRKSYAIKTRDIYQDAKFNLCMNLYLQKKPDYIKYLMDSFTE